MRMMFFLIFLLLMLGGLSYVLWHVWCLLPFPRLWKGVFVVACALCFLSLFLVFGGGVENWPVNVASAVYTTGTSSVIVLLYAALTFLLLDLLRLCRFIPSASLYDNGPLTAGIAVFFTGLLVWGNIRHNSKVRVALELATEKSLPKDYTLVMMSDLHLGYHHQRPELARWVDLINAEHPDAILIAGDIIDISVRPLLLDDMAAEFRRLEAPVYACLGNHEYYSRRPEAVTFYRQAGIRLLIDSCAIIDNAIAIIGRDDRTNPSRKPLQALCQTMPDSLYTIVLDHQPYALEEAERQGVDFQLSGHTHHGQVWPVSWLTDALYECAFGPWQRGSTRYYVSSGLGIWGGKFRIGTQSEYIVVSLHASQQL